MDVVGSFAGDATELAVVPDVESLELITGTLLVTTLFDLALLSFG